LLIEQQGWLGKREFDRRQPSCHYNLHIQPACGGRDYVLFLEKLIMLCCRYSSRKLGLLPALDKRQARQYDTLRIVPNAYTPHILHANGGEPHDEYNTLHRPAQTNAAV
jgi:hypothetical protein